MAPGYVIALCLEGAGLIGLVVAASMMRADWRARSAELRDFLRSGRTTDAVLTRRGSARGRAADLPVILARPSTEPVRNTAARAALRRAIGWGGTGFETLSAG